MLGNFLNGRHPTQFEAQTLLRFVDLPHAVMHILRDPDQGRRQLQRQAVATPQAATPGPHRSDQTQLRRQLTARDLRPRVPAQDHRRRDLLHQRRQTVRPDQQRQGAENDDAFLMSTLKFAF